MKGVEKMLEACDEITHISDEFSATPAAADLYTALKFLEFSFTTISEHMNPEASEGKEDEQLVLAGHGTGHVGCLLPLTCGHNG
jgi:hypothetical protein